jgi:N6-adenosine-specific RNA methylase IME4
MSKVSWGNLTPPYGTIVVDPPWRYNATTTTLRSHGRGAGAEHHYPTLDNHEIAELPVQNLAANQAHIYLWVTTPRLLADRHGRRDITPMDIMQSWGFHPITIITWVKPGGNGTGWYFRGQTEHVLFGIKGKLGIPADRRKPNVIHASRQRHSSKPQEFFNLVQEVSPGPYVELFARNSRAGWDCWGNEILM